jgi:hypothetical protein
VKQSVYYDDKAIWSKDGLSTKFNFIEFKLQQRKFAEAYSDTNGLKLNFVNIQSTIVLPGKDAVPMIASAGNPIEWIEIAEHVQHLRSEGKKNLIVQLDAKYSRFKEGKQPKQDTEWRTLSSAEGEASESEKEETRPKKRASATTRQFDQISSQSAASRLFNIWLCNDSACSNNKYFCYWQRGSPGASHYKITPAVARAWGEAISKGEATEDAPSTAILSVLALEVNKKAVTKQTRDQASTPEQAPETPAQPPLQAPAQIPAQLPTGGLYTGMNIGNMGFNPYFQGPMGPFSPYMPQMPQWPQYTLPQANYPQYTAPIPPQQVPPVAPPIPAPIEHQESVKKRSKKGLRRPDSSATSERSLTAPSSPIRYTGDYGILLREYITWHQDQAPSQHERLAEAYQKLHSEDYDLKQIQRFTDANWRHLGMPIGLGKRLQGGIKGFLEMRVKELQEAKDYEAALLVLGLQTGGNEEILRTSS